MMNSGEGGTEGGRAKVGVMFLREVSASFRRMATHDFIYI